MAHIRRAPNGRSPISITPRSSCVGYLTIAKPPRSSASEHGGRSWRSTAPSRRRRSCAIVSRRSERMCECATPKSRLRRHSPCRRQSARAQWLDSGLAASWGEHSGLGSAGAQARRAVLRAIKPYTTRQARARRAARRGGHRVAGRRRGAARSDRGARGAALETGIAGFGCRGRTRRAQPRAIDAVRDDLTRLDQQLHAPPALSDPSLLRVRDEHGREVIGFEGGAGSDARDVYLGFENVFRSDEAGVAEPSAALRRPAARPRARPRRGLGPRRTARPPRRRRRAGARCGQRRGHGRSQPRRRVTTSLSETPSPTSRRSKRRASAPSSARNSSNTSPTRICRHSSSSRRECCGPEGILDRRDGQPRARAVVQGVLDRPDARDVAVSGSPADALPAGRLRSRSGPFPGGTGVASKDRRTQPAYSVLVETQS